MGKLTIKCHRVVLHQVIRASGHQVQAGPSYSWIGQKAAVARVVANNAGVSAEN